MGSTHKSNTNCHEYGTQILKSGEYDASKNGSYNSIIFAKCNNYNILLISLEFGKDIRNNQNLRNYFPKKIIEEKKCLQLTLFLF
jgi:hypothetical protein